MTDPKSNPWQSFSLGKWVGKVFLYIFLVFALFELLVRGSETEHRDLLIGGQEVKVTITASFRRGPGLDHTGVSIGREYTGYKVRLDFSGAPSITFHTEAKPEAIWRLNDQLYFVGAGFRTAKIKPDGTLVPISKRDLPEGPRPWNIGLRPDGDDASMEVFYQRYAE